jgi:transposase
LFRLLYAEFIGDALVFLSGYSRSGCYFIFDGTAGRLGFMIFHLNQKAMSKPLEVIHPHAGGIDIGSQSFFVDAGEEAIKVFPTYTEGCHALRDYLKSLGINTVAMESTGVYWVVLHAVLEEAGIEVYLVNGRDAKNMPGRKSDVRDCQWLRQLHTYGLLRKSFIPPEHIRTLRSYMRLRQDHIRASATQALLMQKALTQMNIRITEVISDITGVSGMRMIEAILKGERDRHVLVALCDPTILAKKKELVLKALEGEYRQEHLFALGQAHRTWQHYNELITQCDKEMEILLGKINEGKPDVGMSNKRKPIRKRAPQINELPQHLLKMTEGKDPTAITGITDYSFLQIVSEVGTDMSAWKTEKHFTSWLKLCPQKSRSGKMFKHLRIKHHNKANLLFRNLAQGMLTTKHVAIGSFARRIKAKRGSSIAIKAVARKIACYYYRVMTRGEVFVERGIAFYEEQLKEQKKKYIQQQAFKLNMQLVPL